MAYPATVSKAQAIAIARDHAKRAFDIAGKTTGVKSAKHKSGKALVESLTKLECAAPDG